MLSTAEGHLGASSSRRILGGSYKSAWFLEHRIRSAMASQGVLPAVPVAYAARVAGRIGRPCRLEQSLAPPGRLRRLAAASVAHRRRSRSVGLKYLAAYWDEARWRDAHRDNPNAFRETVLALLDSPWLPYDVLTASLTTRISRRPEGR